MLSEIVKSGGLILKPFYENTEEEDLKNSINPYLRKKIQDYNEIEKEQEEIKDFFENN
jgi:hypothetical protein